MLRSNKNEKYRISYLVSFSVFLIGFLGFSQLSNILTKELLHFPIYFPEPFFFILIILLYQGSMVVNRPKFTLALAFTTMGVLFIWTSLVFLAATEGSLVDALSTGRPYLYAFIASLFGGCLRDQKIEYVFSFLLGVVVGELLNVSVVAPHFNESYRGISSINLIGVFSLTAFVLFAKRTTWFIIAIPILISVSFLSGFRVALVAVLLGLLVPLLMRWVRTRNPARKIRMVLKIPIVLVFIGGSGYIIVKYLLDIHPYAYYRVVNRSLAFLNGDIDGSQDGGRLTKLIYYLNHDFGGIFPSGFIMKTRDQIGDFNDVPFLNFTNTFGVPIGLIIMLSIFVTGLYFAFKVILQKSSSTVDLTSAAFLPFFIFLLTVNGRFAYIVYESVLVGFVFGYWVSFLLNSKKAASKSYF